ncbi:AAA-like domain-containing protein [Nostoc sp. XA010]|uniref:AAA-like domain-containing protein n=1 Tax=Nostoc sp. XA010 TaxID=2780407 RepID=UPI001E497DCA|nr:AAA-like domain-containing protein [Nostoc sp. XA010]MCC5659226.1 AAA-like domain-containing protein [Nostoc sp. XA010]
MRYQVGGSLKYDDSTYIVRQADEQLYTGLKTGDFCYVFNSHQTGKSSLLHRTIHRLEKENHICVYLSLGLLATNQITPIQWYKGIIFSLFHKFNLTERVNFGSWWEEQSELDPVQGLYKFVEQVLLREIKNNRIFIFIDNINSLLSLNFPINDFFIWIRYYYEQQAHNPSFQRLHFALFGVASPSNLIADRYRNPFKIGQAIKLCDFQLHEVMPLAEGLEEVVSQPQAILAYIIHWTRGQPFLTQKLCQLVVQVALESYKAPITIPKGAEGYWVEQLVRSRIIQHWEFQDEPQHLRTIRDRLLFDEHKAGKLLNIYQQVLQVEELRNRNPIDNLIPADNSEEQTQLLLSGLVGNYNGYLRVKNPIYRSVFTPQWVSRQLENLPFSW